MATGTTSLPRFCSGMATGKAAPRGPNYSVTAGERSEPADGEPHIYMYGPKGVERAYALHSQPRQQTGVELPPEGMTAQDTHTRRAFDPLGADGGGGHSPRVSAANPRRDGPRKQTTAPARKRGAVVGDIYRRMPGDGFISPLSYRLRRRCRRAGLRGRGWRRRRGARAYRPRCRRRPGRRWA